MKIFQFRVNKLVLIFMFGIGLPCLMLSYFAYRGILNDQALIEKQQRSALIEIAQGITNQIYNDFSAAESNFTQWIKSRPYEPNISITEATAEFKADFPIVEAIFFLNQTNAIEIPVRKMLYYHTNYSSMAIPFQRFLNL